MSRAIEKVLQARDHKEIKRGYKYFREQHAIHSTVFTPDQKSLCGYNANLAAQDKETNSGIILNGD